MRILKILILIGICLNIPAVAYALELKIFDQMGLERAFSKVKDHGSVIVTVISASQPLPNSITLTNVDGLTPDKQLNNTGNNVFKAQNVGPGSWKIILADPSLVVKEVRITD